MKTAIYIEDGITQIVLTPEPEYEKDVIKGLGDKISRVQVFQGTFYDCRGGWVRQTALKHKSPYSFDAQDDTSIIMRLDAETDK